MRSVFDLPELVEHIAVYLTPHEIVQCLSTCQLLHDHFTLLLYQELCVRADTKIDPRVVNLSPWVDHKDLEVSDPAKDSAEVQLGKQYARRISAEWKENLHHVRCVVATGRAPLLLDFLALNILEAERGSGQPEKGERPKDLGGLSRLHRLNLDYGFIRQESDKRFPFSSYNLQIRPLVQLLVHPSCRLFLTELGLPCKMLHLPKQLLGMEDSKAYREFLHLLKTGGLEQLKTIVIHRFNDQGLRKYVGIQLAVELIEVLLEVKTLETIDLRITGYRLEADAMHGHTQYRSSCSSPKSRLKHLNLGGLGLSMERFLIPILRNYGSALKQLECSMKLVRLNMTMARTPS